jgi:hypothetical protein
MPPRACYHIVEGGYHSFYRFVQYLMKRRFRNIVIHVLFLLYNPRLSVREPSELSGPYYYRDGTL